MIARALATESSLNFIAVKVEKEGGEEREGERQTHTRFVCVRVLCL